MGRCGKGRGHSYAKLRQPIVRCILRVELQVRLWIFSTLCLRPPLPFPSPSLPIFSTLCVESVVILQWRTWGEQHINSSSIWIQLWRTRANLIGRKALCAIFSVLKHRVRKIPTRVGYRKASFNGSPTTLPPFWRQYYTFHSDWAHT